MKKIRINKPPSRLVYKLLASLAYM